ncbi:MAG: lipid-A-disaccharide synthase N-terminal domain-containing protein [Candidatus Micrarchaeia archaeon]
MADYFGIIGLLLILAGWIYELFQAIKNKKSQVPLSFAILYGLGSLLLTLHSIELNDAVFIVLNAAATIIALSNIAFSFAGKGKKAS